MCELAGAPAKAPQAVRLPRAPVSGRWSAARFLLCVEYGVDGLPVGPVIGTGHHLPTDLPPLQPCQRSISTWTLTRGRCRLPYGWPV